MIKFKNKFITMSLTTLLMTFYIKDFEIIFLKIINFPPLKNLNFKILQVFDLRDLL